MVQDPPVPADSSARPAPSASPEARLAALHRTGLLDTQVEEAFDRLTRLAARLLGAPVALVSLVGDDRQFFKSAIGLPEPWASSRSAPLSHTFCQQVVRSGEPLVVGDTRRDPALRHSPAVREMGWIAYAGVPLVTRGGHAVGAMSVVDTMPRLWSERDIELLRDLAASVVTEIELRSIAEGAATPTPTADVFDAAPLGLAELSLDARWRRVNRALCGMLGHAREALLGQPVEAVTHPEDVPPEREAMRFLLAGESPAYQVEKRYLHPSGEVVWALLTVSLVRDADGQPSHFVAGIQDITDWKLAAARQVPAAQDVQTLHRSEDQLRQAQKMEAVGRLAGGIAHDFNNLLTGILGYCDLILQELRPNEPIRGDVEQIRHAGLRAASLTHQLLAFSRRQVLQPRVLSVNGVVAELDTMLRRLLGPDVVLETELDPGLWQVYADPGQLEQVLVNLTVNARDAMPRGGRLAITTANVRLDAAGAERVGGIRAGDYVVVTLSDTGVGMDPATQARIFDPFFTTKAPGQGSGLGLATVYGIVEQSGGHVAVASAPGQGAVFTVYLPRHVGPGASAGPQRDRRALPRGAETVMLVEDEAAVRDSTRRLLERHGYTVLEARNGADALRVFEANEAGIDLVVTDVVMPEIGGRELVERLRTRRPMLKVLFMSGYTEKAIAPGGVMPPGTGFVQKPFTLEALIRRVREVLDG